jgi:hypothetical protein
MNPWRKLLLSFKFWRRVPILELEYSNKLRALSMMRRRFYVRAFLSLCLLVASSVTYAGHQLDQLVSVKQEGKSFNASYQWHLGEGKFRVNVTQGETTRHYVYDGKTLYSCAQLNDQQLAFFKSQGIDQSVYGKFSKGACQSVATDFLVRFFLFPYEAIHNNTISDPMISNISLKESSINLSGSIGRIQGVKCVNFRRLYKVRELKTAMNHRFFEKSCHAPSIKWRQALYPGIESTLKTQKSVDLKLVEADVKKMAGFTLLAKLLNKGRTKGGKQITQDFRVRTTKISKVIEPGQLEMPADFLVVSESLGQRLANIKLGSMAAFANADDPSLGSMLGYFITGGQVTGALLQAGMEEALKGVAH